MSDLDETAVCLVVLGNPPRVAMFRGLVRAGETGKSVGEIQASLSIPASTLSHHLKHLELVGLVSRHREGTTHTCRADYRTMNWLLTFLTEECCVDSSSAPKIPHSAHKLTA
ncbi:MAG: metalloregulator ArsR/SmtB family transcription factor [Alphaproteobacteria bacterium]|nr:metalloregulator ArsR/SmtB family transcription factor [Alphaproteobacteria bacterium]